MNWHKRYITLGPVATVLGLAFKLPDPDRLLSDQDERGITVDLIPTTLSGVEIDRRHLPVMQAFQNGTNWGRDVFIPLDFIIGGPRNYLSNVYRSIPVSIAVEGANILTRNLMVFGQGAVRCHPYLLEEMLALADPNKAAGLARLDKAFWKHVAHACGVMKRALIYGAFGFAPTRNAGRATTFYRATNRYATSFAFLSEVALLSLGSALKRKEMLSARLGDVLGELYKLSAALERWNGDGRPPEDLPLLAACMETEFETIESKIVLVLANLPNRPMAWIARLVILPWGANACGPSDHLKQLWAELLLEPSVTRDRLTENVFTGSGADETARLENAFALVAAAEPLRHRLRKGCAALSENELRQLRDMNAAVAAVIEVDDFAAADIVPS